MFAVHALMALICVLEYGINIVALLLFQINFLNLVTANDPAAKEFYVPTNLMHAHSEILAAKLQINCPSINPLGRVALSPI